MLLSPIFLALGAVATSVLNASGRFARGRDRADRLQPRDHRRRAHPRPEVRGRGPGRRASSPARSAICWSRSGRWPGSGFRYTRASSWRDPQARKALVLMAPRAIGLGVTQITFIVVTALASLLGDGAVSDFNFAFALLQIPLGIIGVPLGHRRCCRRCRATPRSGREASFAGLLTRALRLLIYVMVPIAVLTAVVRQPVVEILFGSGRIRPADLDLIAVTLTAFLVGPDRPRDDRGPGTGVLRPPGHGHAGRRRGRRGGHQLHAGGRARRAARPARDRAGDRDRGLDRGARPARDPVPPAARTSSCAGSAGSGSSRSSAASSPGVAAYGVLELVRRLARDRAGPPRPDRRGGHRERGLRGRLRRCCRSCCGSRNCRLSSGSWPTSSAARSGRDGPSTPARLGPVRRGERPGLLPPAQRHGPPSRP